MDSTVPTSASSAASSSASPSSASPAAPQAQTAPSDQALRAYVGYLAGWFDLGQLAAGRRLERSGVREPLLSD